MCFRFLSNDGTKAKLIVESKETNIKMEIKVWEDSSFFPKRIKNQKKNSKKKPIFKQQLFQIQKEDTKISF